MVGTHKGDRRMSEQDLFDIALAIQNIALLSDDETLKKIKPKLNRIEEIVLKWQKESKNQKTGHWIEQDGYDGDTYYDCSECGESFCLIEGTPTDNLYNYCPNCGAKMEGE